MFTLILNPDVTIMRTLWAYVSGLVFGWNESQMTLQSLKSPILISGLVLRSMHRPQLQKSLVLDKLSMRFHVHDKASSLTVGTEHSILPSRSKSLT
jgi:hypothetical protein